MRYISADDTRVFAVSVKDLERAYSAAVEADVNMVDAMWMNITADCERADAAAAQALMVERAAGIADAQEAQANKRANEADEETQTDWDGGVLFGTEIGARMIAANIRTLAPDAGTAELEKLREWVERAEAERDRVAAINVKHCESVNTLLVDGARLEDRANAAEASLAAQTALVETLTGALDAAKSRKTFPILKGEGTKIDYQLVADHAEQARANHYQTVERLAERGGLSWCELYAVLHNRKWEKIETNEAMIACRALEARYLAALALDAATLAAMTPEERALCERSLAMRDGWKKVAEGQG